MSWKWLPDYACEIDAFLPWRLLDVWIMLTCSDFFQTRVMWHAHVTACMLSMAGEPHHAACIWAGEPRSFLLRSTARTSMMLGPPRCPFAISAASVRSLLLRLFFSPAFFFPGAMLRNRLTSTQRAIPMHSVRRHQSRCFRHFRELTRAFCHIWRGACLECFLAFILAGRLALGVGRVGPWGLSSVWLAILVRIAPPVPAFQDLNPPGIVGTLLLCGLQPPLQVLDFFFCRPFLILPWVIPCTPLPWTLRLRRGAWGSSSIIPIQLNFFQGHLVCSLQLVTRPAQRQHSLVPLPSLSYGRAAAGRISNFQPLFCCQGSLNGKWA